ncbi:hypothetical protein [Streptomyces sp. SP18CS02]|uniref:hypothetical protein n=1 Tax=Streptomyces sp. SP18CS02 TaxID=3002531 RepID=UPI002E76BA26|nr:hypothetical protein [Streptomyces sp. SP18CS02]MEE1754033.1 hypothetical protein [Streptomyces sp. SP18CS02]
MSTTRHLINRQRRLASAEAARTAPPPAEPGARSRRAAPPPTAETGPRGRKSPSPSTTGPGTGGRGTSARPVRSAARPGPGRALPVALAALTVLLGGFGAWAGSQASALRDDPAARNTALTDIARTSEVKGRITKAVNDLFSYDYASPATADRAVRDHLTGKAVEQHRRMLAPVRQQAGKQKLVLTTTVTESGVELIDGDRARVLLYADQSNTRTAAKKDGTTYGAAMFAVEAVHTDGTWRIAVIDTLGAGS